MPKISRSLIIWLIVLAVVIAVFFTLMSPGTKTVTLYVVRVDQRFAAGEDPPSAKGPGGNITQPPAVLTIKDTSLTAVIDGKTYTTTVPSNFDAFQVFASQIGNGTVTVNYQGASRWSSWGTILINFLPLILFGALIIFMLRQAQGGSNQALSFGRSRARMVTGDKPTVTFGDVAGVDEAKQELQEIVEFLKFPEKFMALGARIPRGVLLVGPPGTGKTLLARAVAGEAGVPFFSISGSEFVEMFVGVGASRVRDLFDQAKRNAPCIIFVDEIDAVGRHRGSGLGRRA